MLARGSKTSTFTRTLVPAMTANVLERLPYDVLDVVFTFVDNPTLLKVSLANHELNRLSSKYIFATVEFNSRSGRDRGYGYYGRRDEKDSAVYALERRPELRSVVKRVIVNQSRYYGYKAREYIVSEEYLGLLPSLPNLQEINLAAIYDRDEWSSILTVIEELPRLKKLIVPSYNSPAEHNLSKVHELEIINRWSSEEQWGGSQFAKKVLSIQDLRLSNTQPEFIKLLSNLQYLTWSPRRSSLISICGALSSLMRLRKLKLWVGRENKSSYSMIPSINLPRLVELAIKWRPLYEQDEGHAMLNLIQAIAGKSQLQKLEVSCTRLNGLCFDGDKVVGHIIKVHGPTLMKLKIPSFHLSLATMKMVCMKLPSLEGLWIGVSSHMKAGLISALQSSLSLRSIRILGEGPWIFAYADSLLRQTCTSLSTVKVYRRGRWSKESYTWEVIWEYDYALECAVRRIYGPLKVLVPTKRVRNPENEDYEDEGDDVDMDEEPRDLTDEAPENADWTTVRPYASSTNGEQQDGNLDNDDWGSTRDSWAAEGSTRESWATEGAQ